MFFSLLVLKNGRFELDAVSGWLRLHGCQSTCLGLAALESLNTITSYIRHGLTLHVFVLGMRKKSCSGRADSEIFFHILFLGFAW
jgi:hypothetical protein